MSRKYHIQVDLVVDLDPDRIQEYVEANYQTERERVKITELTGDTTGFPVVFEDGPEITTIINESLGEGDK